MESIHRVARAGNVAKVDRLVAEDGRRLNVQILGETYAEYVNGQTE
jgi:hypothetical protein